MVSHHSADKKNSEKLSLVRTKEVKIAKDDGAQPG